MKKIVKTELSELKATLHRRRRIWPINDPDLIDKSQLAVSKGGYQWRAHRIYHNN